MTTIDGIVRVVGVGMVPFTKPGKSPSLAEMGSSAVLAALSDCGLPFSDIRQALVGHVYGDSTSGQSALYRVGMNAIPIVNVNNNCATGSSALFLGVQAILAGAECVMVLGMEQMLPGALGAAFPQHESPLAAHFRVLQSIAGIDPGVPLTAQLYAAAANEYAALYGPIDDTLCETVATFRRHAVHNPDAVFRLPVSATQVAESPMVCPPLSRLQCCAPTCGAAAIVLASKDFCQSRSLVNRSVVLRGIALETDTAATFDSHSAMQLMGVNETRRASQRVFEMSGLDVSDCQLVELHDSFSINALVSMEALGLAEPGGAVRLVADGNHTYGGRWVINPSGGLISKGHPLGATGTAQVVELVRQLRGTVGERQVPGARAGLAHNQGIGGATVVTLLTAD